MISTTEDRRKRRRTQRRRKGRKSFYERKFLEKLHSIQRIKNARRYLFKKQNGLCALCGKPMNKSDCTLDHIIPTSKGGTNEWNNYQAVHGRCNTKKGNKFPDELKQKEVMPTE